MKKRISAFITAIILIVMTFALPAYADEITWQDNTENGRIEKNSTDEKPPAEVNDLGGDDFVAKEEPIAETGEEDSSSKGMSAEQGTAAALAVAAAGAALLRKRGGRQPAEVSLTLRRKAQAKRRAQARRKAVPQRKAAVQARRAQTRIQQRVVHARLRVADYSVR